MERKPAFAVPRLLRHALRLLVLLGGTLVCWLFLTSAPAQADDAAGHHPVVSGADAVDTTTHGVADELRDASPQAEQALTRATRSAPQPVRVTVANVVTTVGPTLTRTTNAIAAAVDRTVATVHGVVAPVGLAPAVGAPVAAPASLVAATHPAAGRRVHDASVLNTSSVTVLAAGSRSGSSDGAQLKPARGLPAPGEPTTPAGSWTGPSGASATLAGMLLLLFLLLRGRRVRDDVDLPSGPAYPPGNSPG